MLTSKVIFLVDEKLLGKISGCSDEDNEASNIELS